MYISRQVRSKDLCFQFQCDDISMRHTIELKHLTSWKVHVYTCTCTCTCTWSHIHLLEVILSYQVCIILELSLQMFLGEGPRFIAIKIVPFATNRLKNILIAKFHLRNDFFAAESADLSQCSIVFRLGGCVSPDDVVNITEVLVEYITGRVYC